LTEIIERLLGNAGAIELEIADTGVGLTAGEIGERGTLGQAGRWLKTSAARCMSPACRVRALR